MWLARKETGTERWYHTTHTPKQFNTSNLNNNFETSYLAKVGQCVGLKNPYLTHSAWYDELLS